LPSEHPEQDTGILKKKEDEKLDSGDKRTVMVDVGGSFYALKKLLRTDIGFYERDFMTRAGQEGARTLLSDFGAALKDKSKTEQMDSMLKQYSRRGFGDFKIRRMDEQRGVIEVSSPNTIEAWSFKTNRDMQRDPVCSYTCGVLTEICRISCGHEERADAEFSAVEVACVATGDNECRFIVGPLDELPKQVPGFKKSRDSASETALRLNEEILLKNMELQSFNLSLERQVRRKTEELRRAEENYRLLVELSPDPIMLCSVEGKISAVNQSGARMLGYDLHGDLEGQSIKTILAGGTDAWDKLIWRVEMEGTVRNLELELVMKNGNKMVGEVSARFTDLAQGRFVETIVRDITQNRQIHEQMLEAKTESEFLTDLMSHDITNFTVSALYFLDGVKKSDHLLDQDRRNLAIALKDIHAAFELSTSVRDLTRIKSMNEQEVEVKELQQIIDLGIEEAKRNFPERKVLVNFERAAEPKFIRGNAIVSRLFANILTNAIKFDSKDEVVIDIGIEDEVQNGVAYWRIDVADHGRGIPDADKERVFDRFSRLDASAPGSGLGLFVVRYIAKACGGIVWVEDRVKGDSTKGVKMVVLLQKATQRQVAAVSRRRGV
jgi:PAS domain S-box-containing protein